MNDRDDIDDLRVQRQYDQRREHAMRSCPERCIDSNACPWCGGYADDNDGEDA